MLNAYFYLRRLISSWMRSRERLLKSQLLFCSGKKYIYLTVTSGHFLDLLNAWVLVNRRVLSKHSDQLTSFKESAQSTVPNLIKKYYRACVVNSFCYFDIYIWQYLSVFSCNQISRTYVSNQSMSSIKLVHQYRN